MPRNCAACRYSSPVNDTTGSCRLLPPLVKPEANGSLTSYFPPVSLKDMRCGKFKRLPWLWRLLGRTG